MKRVLSVGLLVTIMLVSTVGMSGTAVAAQDEWPDECDDAPIIDSGQYSGAIDTPNDADYFRLQMNKGEYYSFAMVVPIEQSGFSFDYISDVSQVSFDNIENAELAGRFPDITNFQPGVEATWRAFAEEDGVHCFFMNDLDSEEIPYEWQLSLEKNDPDPAGFEITELREENDELESEISDLESEINELESQLDEKDERISELETQLENAEVTIDVSVEPENQASFQVGGSIAVDIDAERAAASDVTLNFAGEEYAPSGGEATIPLDSAGTQQLDINYQDATETVTLDVAEQGGDSNTNGDSSSGGGDDESSSGSDDGESATVNDDSSNDDGSTDGSSDGSGPGFGIVAALVALSGIGYLAKSRFTNPKQ